MSIDDYKKYRWFCTSEKTLVVGGKNALQNDELLRRVLASNIDYIVLHTSHPGSPFNIILAKPERVTESEIEQAAIFTACFSRAWKEHKKKTSVDIFRTSHLSKPTSAAIGTWHVKGLVRRIEVPLQLVLTMQRHTLRAVPEASTEKPLSGLCPGTMDKHTTAAHLALVLDEKIGTDAVLSALPAGGMKVCALSSQKIRTRSKKGDR